MYKRFCKNRITATCKRKKTELPVKSGLAVTPAEMSKLAEEGIPISSNTLGMSFYEGDGSKSWDIPLERVRGVDVAEMWTQSRTIKEKMLNAHRNDVKKFGY